MKPNTARKPKQEIRKILNKPDNIAEEANVDSNKVLYKESPKINVELEMNLK